MATQVKKTGTQSDPFNPNQPNKIDLNPTTYPGPRARPLQRPEVRPRSAPGGSRGGRNSNWDPSSFKKKKPQLDEMPAQAGGNAVNYPDKFDPRIGPNAPPGPGAGIGGGVPGRDGGYNLNDWMPKPGEFGPRGSSDNGPMRWDDAAKERAENFKYDSGFTEGEQVGPRLDFGMKDPRAGGLNKVTGEWTPPDPAYLEGLKNGTIEPEWKRRERMSKTSFLQGGGMKTGAPDYTFAQMKGMPGQGGQQVPGGQVFGGGPSGRGGPEGVYSGGDGAIQRGPGAPAQGGKPSQGPPMGGGRPGRQPLRPGMEYRPGGGQRPVGGGMQGAPQDGGQQGYSVNDPGRGQKVNDMYGVDSTGWYDENGQLTDQGNQGWENYNQANQGGASGAPVGGGAGQDPQEQMRRKLMLMQKQGPNSNPYYGAF